MKTIRITPWIATLALTLVFAGCSLSDHDEKASQSKSNIESHYGEIAKNKLVSALQVKLKEAGTKGANLSVTGKITAPQTISETLHYKWVLPEGVSAGHASLTGEFQGLPSEGKTLEITLSGAEKAIDQPVILTVHYFKGGVKLGNVDTLILKDKAAEDSSKQKATGQTQPAKKPKIIY